MAVNINNHRPVNSFCNTMFAESSYTGENEAIIKKLGGINYELQL